MSSDVTGQISGSEAEIYEKYFVPALFHGWADIVSSKAKVGYGANVLDVACGTGALTRAVAGYAGPDGYIIGMDINESMIQVARRVSPLMEWRVGPAEDMPFSDNQFDSVVSQFGFMFFADKNKALSEMRRIVKPGGQVTVAVWDGLESNPGYAAFTELLARLFGDKVADELREPYRYGNVETLKDYFSKAGMADVDIETKSRSTIYQSIEAWLHLDVKGWTIGKMIGDDGYALLEKEAKKALKQFVQPDGRVLFPSPAHIITWVKP